MSILSEANQHDSRHDLSSSNTTRRCESGAEGQLEPLLDNSTTREDGLRSHDSARSLPRKIWISLIGADESGFGIFLGWCLLALSGVVLGSIMPSDLALPSTAYRWFSNCIGYTYFMSWSVSFYPQLMQNYRRKTTVGLSVEFCALNAVGFACYAIYVCALYFSSTIRELYHDKYGPDAQISIQSNDVAFAVHALILTIATLGQIAYYDGFRHSEGPTRELLYVIFGVLSIVGSMPVCVLFSAHGMLRWKITWLDYFYLLSYIKIGVTLTKYLPQVVLNYQRKSTLGWSIWQIILDLTGGILSDLQLVGDCYVLGDWSGITGNIAKLLLGSVSIFFDAVFMLQHYVWYANSDMTLIADDDRVREGDIVELLL